MGQWSLKERLQPSLLDRLTDLEPSESQEASSKQSMSQAQFKAAVIRDLGWLLNSVALDVCVDLEKYPEVQSSVLNFGLPDMSGHTSANVDIRSMENSIRTVIHQFEPRIIRNSLKSRYILILMSCRTIHWFSKLQVQFSDNLHHFRLS